MRPRARVCRVVLLGLVVAVAGCGGESSDSTATTPAPTSPASSTPAPGVPTVDEVNAVLLGTGDVFTGWQLGPPVNDADLHDSVQVPCADAPLDPAVAARLRAVTGVQFEPAGGTGALLIEFARIGEPEQLAADLDAMLAATEACGPTVTEDGGSVTIEDLALPALGDQRWGTVMRGGATPASEVVWWNRSAHVRVGPVAVTVSLLEVVPVDGTPTITDDEFVGVVETAVQRIVVTA